MKIFKLTILVIFLLIVHRTLPVLYAQSFSLSLSPEKHEIITKRGQTIILPYSLSNLGDPQLLLLKAYKRTPRENSADFDLSAYEPGSSTPQFAVINSALELNKPFLMNGKSTVLFDVEVIIPAETRTGDYYVTFVAESEGVKGTEGTSSIQLEGGIGSNILITVTDSGQIDRSAQITEFNILSPYSLKIKGEKYTIIDSYNSIPFSLTIVNKGKNYIHTVSSIKTTSTEKLSLNDHIILSESSKTIASIPQQCVKANTSECSKFVTSLMTYKKVGVDTVAATVNVNDSQVLYASARIIAVPYFYVKLILGLILIPSTLFLFIKYKQKK